MPVGKLLDIMFCAVLGEIGLKSRIKMVIMLRFLSRKLLNLKISFGNILDIPGLRS